METEALPQCLMVDTEETKSKIADWRKITTGRGSNELNIILYRKLGIYSKLDKKKYLSTEIKLNSYSEDFGNQISVAGGK